ncbi:MAG: hypothetical protein KAJ10_12915 [Thermodesulfovibrionia bacterium]|nr:hypothetical protein [Thermodesulfovibrionia bacterium]
MAKIVIEPQVGSDLNYTGWTRSTFDRKVTYTHRVANIAVGKATINSQAVSVYWDDNRQVWVAEMLMRETKGGE